MKRQTGTWLLALACAMPAVALGQAPGAAPTLLSLDFKADVQADGSLANVEPDAALAPALQAMLRKQVAGWRYALDTWQGTPVLKRVGQRIVAEAVPVATGGFALRIKEVTGIPVEMDASGLAEGMRMSAPRYPQGAQRQGVGADLLYAMRLDANGTAVDVELVDARVPGPWVKQFDAMGREAIAQWRMRPMEVSGQRIDCRMLIPMQFRVSDGAPKKEAGIDSKPYRARYADICPASPVLQTQVTGVLL